VFEIDETPFMTLFIALNQIREKQDPGLQFDFACRSAICGSCAMMVNGRPALACRTLTTDLPDKIHLYPLPVAGFPTGRRLVRRHRKLVPRYGRAHRSLDP
jgi:fumarate reductase iron-sulfur subunit